MSFNGAAVLHQLSLFVPAGKITTLLGSSGSGKSTLVKTILGVLAPNDGTVTIGGCDVWSSSDAQLLELRDNLSALHGGATIYEGSIFGSVSVRDNLLATLYEKRINASGTAERQRRREARANPYLKLWTPKLPQSPPIPELNECAEEWLERFGLNEVADLLPGQIASGLRRRAALASALAVDVQLYILDDPDGAIDTTNRDSIIRALIDTHKRTGATMLVVSHDPNLAETISDRIAILSGGRIIYVGDPREAQNRVAYWYRQSDGKPESPELVLHAASKDNSPAGDDEEVPDNEDLRRRAVIVTIVSAFALIALVLSLYVFWPL